MALVSERGEKCSSDGRKVMFLVVEHQVKNQ